MNNKIKLIISDMDGTLLNSKGELPKDFFRIFKKLKEEKIIFCAASGRAYYNLEMLFESIIDDPNIYFITENGGYIVHQKKDLLVTGLTHEEVKDFIETARNIPCRNSVISTKTKAFIENDDPKFFNNITKYYNNYTIIDDLLSINKDLLKISINYNPIEDILPYFKNYKENYNLITSGYEWLDFTNKHANKGVGVKFIQDLLGIKPSETVIFGDFRNDIAMMPYAEYSYAVANAHPELKEVAKYQTKSNDENGVLETIEKFLLL